MNDCVYIYLDDVNKRCYVGQSCDMGRRHYEHLSDDEFYALVEPKVLAFGLSKNQMDFVEALVYEKYIRLGYEMLNKQHPNRKVLKKFKNKADLCPICNEIGCGFSSSDIDAMLSNYKEMKAEYKKRYYEANKDKIIKQRKEYYEINKDKIAKQCKEYSKANKDKIVEYKKEWGKVNKDKLFKQKKEYCKINKDKIAKYQKEYYEANKDKIEEYQKEYYEVNKDKIIKYQKEYYEINKDKITKQKKEYRKANKDKIEEYYEANRVLINAKKRLRRRYDKFNDEFGFDIDGFIEVCLKEVKLWL